MKKRTKLHVLDALVAVVILTTWGIVNEIFHVIFQTTGRVSIFSLEISVDDMFEAMVFLLAGVMIFTACYVLFRPFYAEKGK